MSDTTPYIIPTLAGLFGRAPLARDAEIPARLLDATELDAMARSGDYFVTLAAQLDELSRTTDDYEVKLRLENLASDLLYLQDNYNVTKKEN